MTVQDTDPLIAYWPLELWHGSSGSCPICLHSDLSSYHEVIHRASAAPNSPTRLNSSPQSSRRRSALPDHPGGVGLGKRRALAKRMTSSSRDRDGSQDPEVTLSFNFTGIVVLSNSSNISSFQFLGTAIYIFGIQPLGVADGDDTPTNMDLAFSIDNRPSEYFKSSGTPGASGFQPNMNVFSGSDLEDGQHRLVVTVGPNSSFLFDHLVYTSTTEANASGTSTSGLPTTPLAQNSPSATNNP